MTERATGVAALRGALRDCALRDWLRIFRTRLAPHARRKGREGGGEEREGRVGCWGGGVLGGWSDNGEQLTLF